MQQLVKDEYITIADAATLLGISKVTMHRWIKLGVIPAYSLGPRRILIKRAELAEIVKPVKREEVEADMKERLRRVLEPLTDEEVARGLAALAQARALGERMLAKRKGHPLPDSTPLIQKARADRTKQLLNL